VQRRSYSSCPGPLGAAQAETLAGALASAYQYNPELNAARAGVRVTDENVPQALSGYRPTITGEPRRRLSHRLSVASTVLPTQHAIGDQQPGHHDHAAAVPRISHPELCSPSRSRCRRCACRIAEHRAEHLRAATQAYMDVLADRAILALRQQNVGFLEEQVRSAEARFDVGEGTRTDIAQANARRAFALAQVSAAQALTASNAVYRQVIGIDPRPTCHASPFTSGMPGTLQGALDDALATHPAIIAARANIDAAQSAVAIAEGALLPGQFGRVSAAVVDPWRKSGGPNDTFAATLRLSVPIYQGGRATSAIRQSIETLGQRRLELDVTREQVRAAIYSAFGGLEAARAQITASNAQVSAAQVALAGTIEEQRVGQRTTLDVLNTQDELITARIAEINARRDLVVASYSLRRRSVGCRLRHWVFKWPAIIRWSIMMRYATVGMVCARPMVVVASSSAMIAASQFPPIGG
jgi:outer membrane protein